MKKLLLLSAMLLIAALLLAGCKAPEPETEPTVDEPEIVITPSPAPTWTPEPTITPRPMEGELITLAPEATLVAIDPIDKPTRPPVIFEPFIEYTSNNLNVKFEIPSYWVVSGDISGSTTLNFKEPLDQIRSGYTIPSEVVIAVHSLGAPQTEKDADNAIDQTMNEMRNTYPGLQMSSKDNNRMLGETGRYVTYWIDEPINKNADGTPVEGSPTLRMRGRCLVVPKDNKLYLVRYACPADFNSDYIEVFYKIRATLELL